ncbi:PepSY domain-containing protein [Halobacillus salinarum]|uniref:PepSY domain-containing protein n=1 Tax=Halobacillus salinarum TaxID=2932257 RepID=A0ABY4EKT4_9BACI|nr:PepSY domain-containing protein [Halobacillus salinarum]UOQ44249.1 PepSY domain-containing protein [Halobacillus salinarum]
MNTGTYNRFWRWHFYAALFITPLLITLTLSGIGYLFYTNVENAVYDHYFFDNSTKEEQLTIDEGISSAEDRFPNYSLSKVIVLEDPYNLRLTLTNNQGEQKYVFLDDHYQMVGSQNAKYTFSNFMRNFHSSLFVGGTFVNYLVELAACWAVFLLLSGIYMTIKGKVFKRKERMNKRQKFKKWHALIGTIITIPMLIIIFTGLPWSAVMGNKIYTAAHNYPAIGIPELKQNPPTSEVNEIPWATRKDEKPSSATKKETEASGTTAPQRINIETLMAKADKEGIIKPYSIVYPQDEKGVFTIAKGSNSGVTGLDVSPYQEVTTYFDQYSGKMISTVGYEDYGILQKWFTWGIPLHEGHLFGWLNKVLNLLVCLSFLTVIFMGVKTWLARKKKGKLSSPPQISKRVSIGFIAMMAFLGLIMPLFGLSLILIVLTEIILWFYNRNKTDQMESHSEVRKNSIK